MRNSPEMLPIESYQVATQHTWESVRRGSGGLDWENQPNPFRSWGGSPLVLLPLPVLPLPVSCSTVLGRWYGVPEQAAVGFDLASLGSLLFHSVAISARKVDREAGHGWSLRVNPSSGNLHPTETWVLVRRVGGVRDGVYHYRVDLHGLELVRDGDWVQIMLGAAGRPSNDVSVVVVLTSIFWREAWKYRRRALRYCHLDAGHAAACIVGAARSLGWQAALVGQFVDDQVAGILDCRRGDEEPLLLVPLGRTGELEKMEWRPWKLAPPPVDSVASAPNQLSPDQNLDPEIISAFASTQIVDRLDKPGTTPQRVPVPPQGKVAPLPPAAFFDKPYGLAARQRRSAVDHDPDSPLSASAFHAALRAAVAQPPRDWAGWETGEETPARRLILPLVFVCRVEGIRPGAYRLLPDVMLELVEEGDFSGTAGYLSLEQEMAGHAAALFILIGDLPRAFTAHGSRGWRYAHFEAGFFGQGLYMAAAAGGFSATGIGAFYDDEVHRFWRIDPKRDGRVLYQFAIGGQPIVEDRLVAITDSEQLFPARGMTMS